MSVPIPTANICDLTPRSSRYIAQTVCRTWKNFDKAKYHLRPELIHFRPDGTGTISSSYTVHTMAGPMSFCATQDIKWRLTWDAWNGPRDMEDMDAEALYETMPKLMKSTRAWTLKPWTSEHRLVPAYIRVDLAGSHSLEAHDLPLVVTDFRTDSTSAGVHLPTEIIDNILQLAAAEDVAASDLLGVCKWTREMVLRKRRKERFSLLTKRFAALGFISSSMRIPRAKIL